MTNATNQAEKSTLEKFYQGFHSFTRMYVEEDKITFFVERQDKVTACMMDAEKRIKALNLPLLVTRPSDISRHYIVSEHKLWRSEKIEAVCLDLEAELNDAIAGLT
jgi:hypothetical protein